MIKCNKCGKEIEYVRIGDIVANIHTCNCGSISLETLYGFYHQQDDIKCPYCNEYPFDCNIQNATNLTRIVVKVGEEYEV